MPQRVAKGYIGKGLKDNTMGKYTDKDEEDLIKEIESDPDIDKKWGPLIKGHVVEIRYIGRNESTGIKKPTATAVGAGI